MTPIQMVLNPVAQLYWTYMRSPVLRQTRFVIVERKIDDVTQTIPLNVITVEAAGHTGEILNLS